MTNSNIYELVPILVALRESVGLTQAEIGLRVGLSRETVSAIENCRPATLKSLSLTVLHRWWNCCRSSASNQLRDTFRSALLTYFGLPAFTSQLEETLPTSFRQAS